MKKSNNTKLFFGMLFCFFGAGLLALSLDTHPLLAIPALLILIWSGKLQYDYLISK